MNSLQILSILTSDKVKELKRVLIPEIFYILTSEVVEHPCVIYSKILHETKEQVYTHWLNTFWYKGEEYSPCSTCYLNDTDIKWKEEQVKEHFISHGHYHTVLCSYNIKEMHFIHDYLQ